MFFRHTVEDEKNIQRPFSVRRRKMGSSSCSLAPGPWPPGCEKVSNGRFPYAVEKWGVVVSWWPCATRRPGSAMTPVVFEASLSYMNLHIFI